MAKRKVVVKPRSYTGLTGIGPYPAVDSSIKLPADVDSRPPAGAPFRCPHCGHDVWVHDPSDWSRRGDHFEIEDRGCHEWVKAEFVEGSWRFSQIYPRDY